MSTPPSTGGTVQYAPAESLPELTWYSLDEGLAKGRKENRPVVVVFTTSEFRGPGTFDHGALRDSLTKCAAVPVKVLPPVAPVVTAKTPTDEQKALQEKHQAAQKAYTELALKYGASTNPTMIFLTPGGERIASLYGPGIPLVNQWLLGLPQAVRKMEEIKAKMAKDQAGAQAEAPKPAPAGGAATGAVGMLVPQELYPDTEPQPHPARAEEM